MPKSVPISDSKNETYENPRLEESGGVDSPASFTENPSEAVDGFKEWIEKGPELRRNEITYLKNEYKGSPYITDKGDLRLFFDVSGWYFLLVIDKSFPRKPERTDLPIKVYLVSPGVEDYKRMYKTYKISQDIISYIQRDDEGEYLCRPEFDDIVGQYLNRVYSKSLSEEMISFTRKWVEMFQKEIVRAKNQQMNRRSDRVNQRWPLHTTSYYEDYYPRFYGRAKYSDGRANSLGSVNSRCKKVVLSDRAFIQIFNESKSRIETETGGLLLGHYDQGVWYVIEASDPGINAVFRVAYHESDDVYQNHICDIISRTYKHPLVFLGMWHRHPGSLDSFSGTDDITNSKYAIAVGNGCISAIINYDPDFRITFYYVEQDGFSGIRYTKVDIEVGNDKIPNKEIMMLADVNDVLSRMD